MFWDDANELIALNKRLRNGERYLTPWPKRFFAAGEDSGGCSDAIDLEDPEYGVFWFDRQNVEVGVDLRSEEKLKDWIVRQIAEAKHDLEADGIDPDTSPEKRLEIQNKNAKSGCISLLMLAVAGFLIIAVLLLGWEFTKWFMF
ncbi:MAG: hypothetical protein AAF593_08000 [Planctomycetota bacterium]